LTFKDSDVNKWKTGRSIEAAMVAILKIDTLLLCHRWPDLDEISNAE